MIQNLNAERLEKNVSLYKLSKLSGYSITYLSRMFKEDYKPSVERYFKIKEIIDEIKSN